MTYQLNFIVNKKLHIVSGEFGTIQLVALKIAPIIKYVACYSANGIEMDLLTGQAKLEQTK